MAKEDIKIEFAHEKDTPGTHRYTELDDDPWIGSLYIKKSKLPVAPEKLSVTLHLE